MRTPATRHYGTRRVMSATFSAGKGSLHIRPLDGPDMNRDHVLVVTPEEARDLIRDLEWIAAKGS